MNEGNVNELTLKLRSWYEEKKIEGLEDLILFVDPDAAMPRKSAAARTRNSPNDSIVLFASISMCIMSTYLACWDIRVE